MEKQKKGIKFKVLYLITGLLPMIIVSVVISIVSLLIINNKVTENEYEKLKAVAITLSQYFEKDVINNGEVSYDEYSDHVYVEQLKEQNIEQTLFKGDTRFLTSLKNTDGSYNEGTQANADIWAQVSKGECYTGKNVTIGNAEYFVCYYPIFEDAAHTKVWGMGFSGIKMDNLNSILQNVALSIIISVVVTITICLFILIFISNPIIDTLDKLTNVLKLLASGNINNNIAFSSICSEFNTLGVCIERLQNELQNAIGAVFNTSGNLSEAIDTVDSLSAENTTGAEQITSVVDQLADTAQSMAESVQDANVSMIKMGESIENISRISVLASDKAVEMSKDSEAALDSMNRVYNSNEHSVRAISQINEQAEACNEAVENIKNAASTIADIASQTNLLALNASIEAARAGESGKGFAVVAENIRVLAEQSNLSATDIAKSVQDVVSKVQQCASMSVDAKRLMDEQKELVGNVSSGMKRLSNAVSEVAEEINTVSTEAAVLDEAKESVLGNISELSAISEENAASAQEVTATIDSIASGISKTKDESGLMKEMAELLSQNIQFFS